MNILMLGRWLPPPRRPVRALREYQFARHLARTHRLTLAFITDNPDSAGAISTLRSEFGDLEFAEVSRGWKSLASAVRLATGESCTLSYFRSEALRTRLTDRTRGMRYDLIYVSSSSAIQYALEIDPTIPLVVDFADVDSQWWVNQAARGSFPGTRFFRTEGARLRAAEAAVARRAAHCIVATTEAAEIVRGFHPAGPISILRSGVDEELLTLDSGRVGQPTVVLSTSLGSNGSVRDVVELGRQVVSAVRRRVPGVRLVIVSPDAPAGPKLGLDSSGVEIEAPRLDPRPVLLRGTVAMAPLSPASHVYQSVLTPMAAGLPMVATSKAALEIGAEAGHDLLVADHPADFAERIAQLLEHPSLRADLATRGRLFVSGRYGWTVIAPQLAALLDRVTKPGFEAPRTEPIAVAKADS